MPPKVTKSILSFYEGGEDHQGRKLFEILDWPDRELEKVYDYIQWLFPLPEPSKEEPNAPILSAEAFIAFRTRPVLQGRLRAAFERILSLYGFVIVRDEHGGLVINEGPQFPVKSLNWTSGNNNHNYARITRMIRCLRIMDLEDEALAFFAKLESMRGKGLYQFRPSSMYWKRAATRPLYAAPGQADDKANPKSAPSFLQDL